MGGRRAKVFVRGAMFLSRGCMKTYRGCTFGVNRHRGANPPRVFFHRLDSVCRRRSWRSAKVLCSQVNYHQTVRAEGGWGESQ